MGTLFIVSTPIGNIEDITIRALKALFSADIIACEDTRITGNLLELLRQRYEGLVPIQEKPQLLPYRDDLEQSQAPQLISFLLQGKNICLVSDAGTPLISDPGYRLIQLSIKYAIPIVVVPGVSAFVIAATLSGLPTSPLTFFGFLPDKTSNRLKMLQKIKETKAILPTTTVCFVSPHKLLQTLDDVMATFGDIQIVLARELTKMHEDWFRGTIVEAMKQYRQAKGEMVLLF